MTIRNSLTIRNTLISIALAFGAWETSDITDTGVIAAVFALLFFACSIWQAPQKPDRGDSARSAIHNRGDAGTHLEGRLAGR